MRSMVELKRGSRAGFTLVELLAVLAIIGILAAIVIPNVIQYMYKARVTRAVSEVNNAETALTGALTDASRTNFQDFLSTPGRNTLRNADTLIRQNDFEGVRQAADFYREFFYELLRQGRDSEFIKLNVDPEVRQKLGTFYMDIGVDPWGTQYNFWIGPIRGAVPLRSYRLAVTTYDPAALEPGDPNFLPEDAYVYTQVAYDFARGELPGQPRPDDAIVQAAFGTMFPGIRAYGYPAPDELPVYIWSSGPNAQNDANLLYQMNRGDDDNAPDFLGGGDDPNNWDNESGWDSAPKS